MIENGSSSLTLSSSGIMIFDWKIKKYEINNQIKIVYWIKQNKIKTTVMIENWSSPLTLPSSGIIDPWLKILKIKKYEEIRF
jgi:hypothetical protein